MLNWPRIDDPRQSEEIVESLARKADRLVFELRYDDIKAYLLNSKERSDRTEVSSNESQHEILVDSKLVAKVQAFIGNNPIFEGLLRLGGTKEFVNFEEDDPMEQDAKHFVDYLDLLFKEKDIKPFPRIIVNGKEY